MANEDLTRVIKETMQESIEEVSRKRNLSEEDKIELTDVFRKLVALAYLRIEGDKSREVEKIIEEGVSFNVH
jgi:hypothetical protein